LFDWWGSFDYFDSAQYKFAQDKFFVLMDWEILGMVLFENWVAGLGGV